MSGKFFHDAAEPHERAIIRLLRFESRNLTYGMQIGWVLKGGAHPIASHVLEVVSLGRLELKVLLVGLLG